MDITNSRHVKSISLILVIMMITALVAGCGTQSQVKAQNDIVILYTNDVHCGIDDYIGYAGLASYKKLVEAKTGYVTLVDCGDAVQGDFIGTVSNGSYIVEIMNEIGFDFAIPGNHEFDYGLEQLSSLIEMSDAQYLGCNITYSGNGTNALADIKPYGIVNYGETSVAFVGISTPESIIKSTPSYFMEGGEYVYGFTSGNNGADLYACVQNYVDECRSAGADYIVILSHLGDDEESAPYTSVDLLRNTTDIDILLDGHAHSTISCRVEQNKNGESVLISSAGTMLANIGQIVITANGYISAGLISDYRIKDEATAVFINGIKESYENDMVKVVATSDISLSGYDENGIRLVRSRETTIGNLCADSYRAISGADIALVNGGGIRADLPAGDITYADMLAVHPYGNTLCVTRATGQEIIDALEFACRATLAETSEKNNAVGESGGFQQVSGLKFTIDTKVKSSVVSDDRGMFVSVSGERRVKDVYVLKDGKYAAIDPNEFYTVASNNYIIKLCGDGFNMFSDNELIIDEGILDYQVLTTYITDYLNGQMGTKYSATEGRITIVP